VRTVIEVDKELHDDNKVEVWAATTASYDIYEYACVEITDDDGCAAVSLRKDAAIKLRDALDGCIALMGTNSLKGR